MIANYEEHGFEVTAEILPETCTACPFYGYSVESDTGICSITLNDIRTDGPQDEERERDCPIKERKIGKWITDGHHIRCDQCGVYFCNTDREGDKLPSSFCPNCGCLMMER